MKKNRMMRLASGLLVAVLLTTSMIAGTFAKYTTQDSAKDEARVAKWGVELQAVGNLYGDSYVDEIVTDAEDTGDNIRVQSLNKAADVVAPGTKNDDGFTFKANGNPEVDYKATVVVKHQNIFLEEGKYGVMVKVENGIVNVENFDEFEGLYTYDDNAKKYTVATAPTDNNNLPTYYTLEDEVETAKYYPVVYKLTGNGDADEQTVFSNGTVADDSLKLAVDEIVKSVNANANTTSASESNNMTTTVNVVSEIKHANTSVAEQLKLAKETLTWEWKICSDSSVCTAEQVGDSAQVLCKADTILGNLMANKEKTQVVVADGNDYVNLVLGTDTLDTSNPTDTANDYLVFKETDTAMSEVLACLQTSFSIDITVTQVD